ncbi:MAG: PfkB family carbohydrate kinase [Candidatus Omnitrophota bacterium]
MSIIVLGTVALDTVKTPFGVRKHMLGGSAVHFSMSARLFTDVNLVAIIGEDFPRKHIDFLRRKGLNLASLIRTPGQTFKWAGEYRGDLNAALTLSTELGVLSTFQPRVSEAQRKIKNIFLANVDPDVQEHLLTHMHSPDLVGLDSMNFWIKNKRRSLLKLLKRVHIYVANDQEAKDLTGEHNLIRAAKRLRGFGPRIVLIKKGEHGVFLYSDKFIFSLPAYPTDKVIDPTGAGDTFAGGLMGYLAKVKKVNMATLRKAVAYGTVAASFNVEGFGVTVTAGLTLSRLEKRLKVFRESVLF